MAAEQLLNGRYRLLRPLGTGGMASVYLAEDLRLGRRVAVKILHPQFAADPSFVARFDAEARIVARLSHPNIVQVYDVGHDGDRYYIVMEYIEGDTLKDAVTREGPFSVTRALRVTSNILAALEFAHAHGLVHRDIKSQNVLLTAGGDVKVTDFGIAREMGGSSMPTLTATNMVIGTVQYFSPEQAQGRPATPQSDVYAAGIVLFEMLTGTLPFEAENPLAVAMQQINQAPPLPTRLNRAIPAPVEAIVLKALTKNPADRYAGAAAMKAAVDGVLTGAAEGTRLAPRAAPPPSATTTARATGPTRVARPAPTVNVARQAASAATAAASPPRRSSRNLWIAIVALALILLALLGVLAQSGGLTSFGFGGGTATETPTAITTTPAAPATTVPMATAPAIVPATAPATHTAAPATATPAVTPTPQAATVTPAAPVATNTAQPTPTDTAVPPTDTPNPTNTPAPQPTPTSTPPPTDTSVPPTDTPQPTDTPTAQAQSGGQAGTVGLAPSSVNPGGTFNVHGNGWTPGAKLTVSADFNNSGNPSTLNQATVHGDGTFSADVTLYPDASPGIYHITVTDDQGNMASKDLTVNP